MQCFWCVCVAVGGGPNIYIPPPLVVTHSLPGYWPVTMGKSNKALHNTTIILMQALPREKNWIMKVIVMMRMMFVCRARRPIVVGGKQNKTKFQTLKTAHHPVILLHHDENIVLTKLI